MPFPLSVARRQVRAEKRYTTFMTRHAPIDKAESELHVDIFENSKEMRVIAELPGVNEEDIRLDLTEDILTISASRANRNYYKDIRLPRASESVIGKIYNNSIFEVILN